ncbi:MAG: T9SS type A sorting domain-containing protein [Flavobacteriales bacterium]|nr:T9SS type A sorting domain-containing protein [Flavobacteriales bacterium]
MRWIILLTLLPLTTFSQKWVTEDDSAQPIDRKEAFWMPTSGSILTNEEAVKQYLLNTIPNLKNELVGIELADEVHSPKGKHYRFTQTINGKKVFRGAVKVNVDTQGRILSVFDHTFPIPETVDTDFPNHGPYHNGLTIHYNQAGNGKLDHYELQEMYMQHEGDMIPVIHLEVVEQSDRYYELVLDRNTKVIYQNDLLTYAAPAEVDSTVTLWVFNPDPLTSANQNYGAPYADNNDQDVLELNAERIPVSAIATFENDTFFLRNDHVQIKEVSLPATVPAFSLTPEFNFTRSEPEFEDANAFYHITYFQNYIRSLGFNNIVNYPIVVDAHALSGSDNSNFNAGFSPPRLQFGEGGVDDAEDADVIIHEYGHAIMNSAAPGTNSGTQRQALDEATGDYFASSYSRFLSSNRWEDVFTWDGHNQYWQGRSTLSTDHYPEDLNNNLYTDADIWSATLMQIWEDIGREATDAIMIQAAYSFSAGMTMPQAAMLFLQADTLLFGGANYTPIHQRMYDRGLLPWFIGIEDVNPQPKFFEVYNTAGFTNGIGEVRILANDSFEANLYNAIGQLVHSETVNSGRLNLGSNGLTAGVYILELVSDKHRETVKLVKH